MRHQRLRGFCRTRAIWIPAALWALLLVPSILPVQRAEAQQVADTALPASSAQADEQIASLLGQVETFLNQGHVTLPAGGNATDAFSQALVLSSLASPAGLKTIAEFPSALKSRADAERTAGHVDLSRRIEVFAEVVSSVITSRDTPPKPETAPSTQSAVATATAGAVDPPARKPSAEATQASATMPGLGPADQATPPVSRESSRGNVGASASKAITDTKSPLPAFPVSTEPVAQHVSPSPTQTDPRASSDRIQNDKTAKGSERSQVAALMPATAPLPASPHGTVAKPEPARVPPMSAAMVDALLKQGKAMLSLGDISAARLLFARAAESGNGEAALALGDTYNPEFLAEHGVVGPQADLELAKGWYRKALTFGEPRARERLAGLSGDTHAEAQGPISTQ